MRYQQKKTRKNNKINIYKASMIVIFFGDVKLAHGSGM
jgi:hypothetical protein